ncbi:MAG: MATE family efflux transporter [Lentisphaeria bacterium]|nr:MATE family efflux transporter [Lentisphaeria bacterium]
MITAEFDKKGCYSYQKICAVTMPILVSMLVEHVIGLTDTAFLGRVSEVALGASALGSVYFLAFFVLGSGFSFGAQILIARRNGEKNFRKTGHICYAGGFFLILLSLLLMAAIKFFSPSLLPLMIQSDEICKATIQYLDWRTYGMFFAFAVSIFRAFYVGIAQTKILTYCSIAMVLSNILLNYGLIFGKFGLPEMGIAGAALASSIAEAIALCCYIFYTVKFIDLKKYGFNAISAVFSPGILKKVFSVSFWMMLQPFISVGIWFFFFIAVERLGERPLAVINIVRSLSALPFIIIHAFATSTNSLVSNLIGENKISQVWRLIGKIMISAYLLVVPLLIAYALFPECCLRIYTDDPGLIAASVNAVYVMCIGSFIQIGAFILFNAVSGTGSIKTTVVIECFNLVIYVAFVWFVIFCRKPSPAVAWSSEILYQSTIVLSCLLFLLFGRWQNKKL